MKKKIIIIVGIICLTLAAIPVIIVVKLNDIVETLRPQIEKQLSATLKTPVQLGAISASIFPNAEISVGETKILTPDGKATALSIEGASASVALKPLLSKRLSISTLELSKPRVIFIKDVEGTRIKGLPSAPAQSPTSLNNEQRPPSPQGASQPVDITVSRITITDGEISIDDTIASSSTTIRSINVDAGIAVQGKEVSIPKGTLSFAVSKLPSVTFTGSSITFSQESGKLSVGSLDLSSDIGRVHAEGTLDTTTTTGSFSVTSPGVDLKKVATALKASVPTLGSLNLSGLLSTSVSLSLAGPGQPQIRGPITLKDMNADLPGSQKLRGLRGDINLQGTPLELSVSSSNLQLSLHDRPLSVSATIRVLKSAITIQSLSVKGLGGESKISSILQRTGSQGFTSQSTLSTISMSELLSISQPSLAPVISGTITSAKGAFSGNLSGDVVRSVSGPGDITITDFILKGVNLPNLILTKVSGIPLLEGTLRSHIAPEHQKYFNDPDTRVRELKADYSLGGGVITLKSLSARSDAFLLESKGTMSMSGDLNLSSTFVLNQEISAALAKRSKTVAAMLNPRKMLEIPVVIQGKSPRLIVIPDISKLLQGAGGKILQEKAGSLLEKALGNKKEPNGKKKPLGGVLGF